MWADRRPFRGHNEFHFGLRPSPFGWTKLSIRARDSSFAVEVMLEEQTSDVKTFRQVFCECNYNLRRLQRYNEIVANYKQSCERGRPMILDLGANVGLSSLYLTKNWPEAQIVAVEPSARNYNLLVHNTVQCPRVTPRQEAVAASEGSVVISNPESDGWAFQTRPVSVGTLGAVPSLPIRRLMQEARAAGAVQPFLCKIDIEGAESDLFGGEIDWIDEFPVLIIELHDWMFPGEARSASFLRAISQRNRDFIHIGENVFSVRN